MKKMLFVMKMTMEEFKKKLNNIIKEIQETFEKYEKHLKIKILVKNLKEIIKKYKKI